MRRRTIVAVALAVGVIAGLRSESGVIAQEDKGRSEGQGAFSFALIGDMPYGPEGDAKFPNVMAEINADRQLAFVVHDGDFKNGSTLCSDAMFFDRLNLFNSFERPFVFVPGDNEWTDCHRPNNGSYDPIERLTFLRSLFFSTDQSLGEHTMTLTRQSADPRFALYRENVRWTIHDVMFVGLHVVGSNNNLGRTPAADAEYAARNAANIAWLNESFARAAERRNRAVMVVIQANPNFELPASNPARSGFNDFLAALEAATVVYGQPVVLVHGDSHYFRIDKPMLRSRSGRRVENFTRVETFGELDNHWLHVSVEPKNPNVFGFDQRIVAANLIAH
jgi:hypothetical protein